MDITIDHISRSTPCNRRPGYRLDPTSITVHSTGNFNSTARNERDNLERKDNPRDASFHYVVGENMAIECIPPNEVAWHAGDGANGPGNRTSISIEMCESGSREKVIQRTKELVVYLMKKHNIRVIKRHYDWTRKNCPRILNDDGKWSDWFVFLNDVTTMYHKPESKRGDLTVQIKKGDKGEMVKLIHFFLASLGYTQMKHVDIDEYQDFTVDAVKRFQQDQKLTKPTPGEVDFETFSAFAKVMHVFYKDRLKTNK